MVVECEKSFPNPLSGGPAGLMMAVETSDVRSTQSYATLDACKRFLAGISAENLGIVIRSWMVWGPDNSRHGPEYLSPQTTEASALCGHDVIEILRKNEKNVFAQTFFPSPPQNDNERYAGYFG